MSEDEDHHKVVRLRKSETATHNEIVAEDSIRLRESIALAKLAMMPVMQYERARLESAKDLGWRPSFLDRLVEQIRYKVGCIGQGERPFGETGDVVNFYGGDTVEKTVLLAHFKKRYSDKICSALLRTDGSGEVITGVPRGKA